MAASAVTIRHQFQTGSLRCVIGDFTNATDANGEIDTGLSSVRDFQVMGRGSEDRDCQIWRNSTSNVVEYTYNSTVAHLGGRVHFRGLATGGSFYRFIAWGT